MTTLQICIDQAQHHWEAWNVLGFEKRAELLEKAIKHCPPDTQAMAKWQIDKAIKLVGNDLVMPSYTGESNTLSALGRGVFICTTQDDNSTVEITQIVTALITGNTVVVLNPKTDTEPFEVLPSPVVQVFDAPIDDLATAQGFAGLAYCADDAEIIRMNRLLAQRDGLLVQLVGTNPDDIDSVAHTQYTLRFITERTISNNTTAVGGNATLLEMGAH